MRGVRRYWTIMLFVVAGCIDPYDQAFEETSNYLVVEGFISTDPGPHLIKLTTTRSIYNTDNQYKLYVEDARVSVVDEDGHEAIFTQQQPGHYYSEAGFAAIVGKKYRLRITGFGDREYESSEEEVYPAEEMHSIRTSYTTKKYVSQYGSILQKGGYNISARVNDDPSRRNHYLFWVRYTYIVFTNPPSACCSVCWISQRMPDFEVVKDVLLAGARNTEVQIAFFPIVASHFASRVYVEAEQFTISPGAYAFWKSLYDIKELQGTVFDPAPARLQGNIFNTGNPEEPVIGYFFASDVARKGRFIYREEVPQQILPPVYNTDCRQFENSSTKRPVFWD